MSQISNKFVKKISTDPDNPTTFRILIASTIFCYTSQHVVSSWMIFRRYSKLRNAVQAVQVVDKHLQDTYIEGRKVNLMKRFSICFLYLSCTVFFYISIYNKYSFFLCLIANLDFSTVSSRPRC